MTPTPPMSSMLTDDGIRIGSRAPIDLEDLEDEEHLEHVAETSETVLYADHAGHEINEWSDALDLERSELSEAMHELGRALSEHDWSAVDPVAFEKPGVESDE